MRISDWSSDVCSSDLLLDPDDIRADRAVRSVEIGRVPKALADNFEGATVTVADGRTWLWLVSDDNYSSWQRSLLLQFELVGLPPRLRPATRPREYAGGPIASAIRNANYAALWASFFATSFFTLRARP